MDPPNTQITVQQDVQNIQAGEVKGVEIHQVVGDVYVTSNDRSEIRDRQNKLILLRKVRDFWVEGVLMRSLHGVVLLELGKKEEPCAVERPWDRVLQLPEQPGQMLPNDRKLSEVFDEASRALLILGPPGSGKTTTLLELASELITRAEHDPTQPIPVVLNLSSFRHDLKNLVAWLVDELNSKYQIPRKMGSAWIETNDLLFLLDGLDEAPVELRATCAKAINHFRKEHGLTGLVICSRSQEYEAAATSL